MDEIKVYDAEYKFMNIVWEHAPIKSSKLVHYANQELGWKKSTTYTVIRRLCDRGVIKNESSVVYPLIDRQNVMCSESEEHIDKIYNGSLKLFFTTFLKKENLTTDEISELKKIIDEKEGRE